MNLTLPNLQDARFRAASALNVVEGTAGKRPPISPELAVIEAALPSGALVENPSNGGPAGIKWRVRVFEYGLSKNRYPDPGLPSFGSRETQPRETLPHETMQSSALALNRSTRQRVAAGLPSQEALAPEATAAATAPLKWTRQSARQALRHLEGARCFADHSLDGLPNCGTGRSVRDLVGFYSDAAMGPRGPEATLTLLESDGWARAKLLGGLAGWPPQPDRFQRGRRDRRAARGPGRLPRPGGRAHRRHSQRGHGQRGLQRRLCSGHFGKGCRRQPAKRLQRTNSQKRSKHERRY